MTKTPYYTRKLLLKRSLLFAFVGSGLALLIFIISSIPKTHEANYDSTSPFLIFPIVPIMMFISFGGSIAYLILAFLPVDLNKEHERARKGGTAEKYLADIKTSPKKVYAFFFFSMLVVLFIFTLGILTNWDNWLFFSL